MYSFLRAQGFKRFMLTEAPYFVVAFLIADAFYKWRSFGLELLGFLVTWFILSAVGNTLAALLRERRKQAEA